MTMIIVPSWFVYMASASFLAVIILLVILLAMMTRHRESTGDHSLVVLIEKIDGVRQQLAVMLDTQQSSHKHMKTTLDALKSKLDFWAK